MSKTTEEIIEENNKRLEELMAECIKYFKSIQGLIVEMKKIDKAQNVSDKVLKELNELI